MMPAVDPREDARKRRGRFAGVMSVVTIFATTRYRGPGNPTATRQAILTLVDSDDPPRRMFLGEAPLAIATADYDARLAAWREWQPVAAAAQG